LAAISLTRHASSEATRLILPVLDALARGHLIEQAAPGRYAMHDLLRAYARELAGTEDSEEGKSYRPSDRRFRSHHESE
jgi:hypothetical protein